MHVLPTQTILPTLAALGLLAAGALPMAAPAPAQAAGERKVWTHQIGSHQEFLRFTTPLNGKPFTKFVIVPDAGKTYIFWTAVYPFHFHFVTQVLLAGDKRKAGDGNPSRDGDWDRQFHMGAIGWQSGYYAYEFLESDTPAPHVLRSVHKALTEAFVHGADKLRFRPVTDAQRGVLAKAPEIPWVAADFLTSAGQFQLLSPGRAVGQLRIPPATADVAKMALGPSDIVVLEQVPDDIAPVAGIISTRFTSPLGHVNLRARAWKIPNTGWKGALKVARPLKDRTVLYEARADGAVLRLATDAEVADAKQRRSAKRARVEVPASDLTYRELADLRGIRRGDVARFGTKASNLGELANQGGDGAFTVPGGFALPFGYYTEHLRAHGLDKLVTKMLTNGKFRRDRQHREGELEHLRRQIEAAPLDPALAERIGNKVQERFGERGVFVRSSTNAEDLPGFNGAGLYDTVPNVKGQANLAKAVKQVWSSLWNFRAYEERERARIDHRGVYPAVLMQVAAGAAGAGVIVTKNIFDPQAGPAVFINAKRGLGIRVVGGGRIPEQVLYDESSREIRVISRSDDAVALVVDESGGVREVAASKQPFLTKGRIQALVRAAVRVRQIMEASKTGSGPEPAQDIEWLIGADDEVKVVQTRPFVDGT